MTNSLYELAYLDIEVNNPPEDRAKSTWAAFTEIAKKNPISALVRAAQAGSYSEAMWELQSANPAGQFLAASVVSGVVGLVNSMSALTKYSPHVQAYEALTGNQVDWQIEEAEAMKTLYGNQGKDYYNENKTGADVTGLLLSSVVPATLSTKAVNFAAKTGILGNGLKAATGLATTDYMIGSAGVAAAKAQFLRMANPTVFSKEAMSAWGVAGKSIAAEIIVGEAFFALMQNQNALLNPESTDALESMANITTESLSSPAFYVITGAFAGLRALSVKSHLHSAYREKEREVKSILFPKLDNSASVVVGNAGDALHKVNQELVDLAQMAVPAGDDMFLSTYSKVQEALTAQKNLLIAKLNPTKDPAIAQAIPKSMNTIAWDKVTRINMDDFKRPTDVEFKTNIIHRFNNLPFASEKQVTKLLDELPPEVQDELFELSSRQSIFYMPGKEAKAAWKAGTLNVNSFLIDPVKLIKVNGKDAAPKFAAWMDKVERPDWASLRKSRFYLNTETGEAAYNVFPALRDIADIKVANSGKHLTAGKKQYYKEAGIFTAENLQSGTAKLRQMEAQWIIEQKVPSSRILGKSYILNLDDLPATALALHYMQKGNVPGIQTTKGHMTLGQVTEVLRQKKTELWEAGLAAKIPQEQLAAALNVSSDGSILNRISDDLISPQWVQVETTVDDIFRQEQRLRTNSAMLEREEIRNTQLRLAAREVIGAEVDDMLPELRASDIFDISALDSRQGSFNAARTAFGSFRDQVASIGKMVNDTVNKRSQVLEEARIQAGKLLHHPNATKDKLEFRAALNKLHEDWYTLARAGNGTEIMVPHRLYTSEFKLVDMEEFAIAIGKATDDADIQKAIQALNDTRDIPADIIPLGKLPGKLMRQHYEYGQKASKERLALAESRGQFVSHIEDVMFPIHKDLKVYKFYKFVLPREARADLRRGIIYAKTQQELDAKTLLVQKAMGKDYMIIDNKVDAQLYAKAQADYNADHDFVDILFNASKKNQHRTKEFVDQADLDHSSALDDMFSFHQRRSHRNFLAAVENRYAPVIEELQVLSNRYSTKTVTSKGGADIYADTLRTLKAKETDNMFSEVSDWLSTQGSALINKAFAAARGLPKAPTTANLQELNESLAKFGYQTPFKSLEDLQLATFVNADPRVLSTGIRTLNSLASLTMLTADMANSILNVVSTPILAAPVLREALKKATDGSLDAMVHVMVPGTKIKELTPMKLILGATKEFFTASGKQFLQWMRQRNLATDFLLQYREAADFQGFQVGQLATRIEQWRTVVGKYTQHQHAEDLSKFIVGKSLDRIARAAGITDERELYTIISSGIDKVHGVHRKFQRANIFNGLVGQSLALFQSYSFNWMQQFFHYIEQDKRNAAIMLAMQSMLFGPRSLPAFDMLNREVGKMSGGEFDVYSLTGADDPDSWNRYLLYGLGSHATIIPTDLFSRGNMNPRNPLFLPVSVDPEGAIGVEIPAVQIVTKMIKTAAHVASAAMGDAPTVESFLQGMAHNGMNRPLQGLATIASGRVTTQQGVTLLNDANYTDYEQAKGYAMSAAFARLLGTRPMREGIMLDTFYRHKAYDAAANEKIREVGFELRMKMQAGELTPEDIDTFALSYEKAGGNRTYFNRYLTQQLSQVNESQVEVFRKHMAEDTIARRVMDRME